MITYKRPTTIGQKPTNYKQTLCTLWLPWKTQQTNGPNFFAHTDKKKTFPLNYNLTCAI